VSDKLGMLHALTDLVEKGCGAVHFGRLGWGKTFVDFAYGRLEERLLSQVLESVVESTGCLPCVEERLHCVREVVGSAVYS
jgi:hypothetical protein